LYVYVHIYAKSQNFIQLSPTFTKLCHTKRDHLVNRLENFYILLNREKLRHLRNSMTDLQQIWQDDEERLWSVPTVKSLILKIQDGGRPIRLTDHFCIKIHEICIVSILSAHFRSLSHYVNGDAETTASDY